MKLTDFREDKQHGTLNFPVQYYLVDEHHPQYVMPLHWHRELELVRILSGTMTFYLDNNEYSAAAGDILLFGSGVFHRGEPQGCVYECVVFDLGGLCRRSSKINQFVQPLIVGDVDADIILTGSEIAAEVGRLMTALANEPPYFDLIAYSALTNLLTLLYTDGHIHRRDVSYRSGHQLQMLASIISWINENYAEKITLRRLSQISAVSEKYLCRFFREFTGYTPIEYINRLRIERACAELKSGKAVTEVAFDCGFHDAGYFTKLFRRYKGITPTEYIGK